MTATVTDAVTSPAHVGVLGGGRMGSGIAHAWLVSGAHVTVVEKDAESANLTRDRIVASVTKAVDKNPGIGDRATLIDSLQVVNEIAAVHQAQLVIESVPESVPLKRDVLQRIEKAAPQAVLATNTSAISIDVLARGSHGPRTSLDFTSSTRYRAAH